MKNKLYAPFIFLIMIMFMFLSSSCFASRQTEIVAEKFLRAVVQNDLATLQEVIEPKYHEDLFTGIIFLSSLSYFVGDVYADYTELSVRSVSNDGSNAVVQFEGKMLLRALGTQIIIPSRGYIYLTKINGKWYVTDLEGGPELPL